MKSYLTELRLNGIKNINNEILISFYNTTLPTKFQLNRANIKAIYGENGVGKSAIIHALDMYKTLMVKNNYLSDSFFKISLDELVNKEKQSFSLASTFIFYDDMDENKIIKVFSHEIVVTKKNDNYRIEKEAVYDKKRASSKCVYLYENEEIQYMDVKDKIKKEIIFETKNLLNQNSIISQSGYNHNFSEILKRGALDIRLIFTGCLFSFINTEVILWDTDQHESYFKNKRDAVYDGLLDFYVLNTSKSNKNVLGNVLSSIDVQTKRVEKENIKHYENKIQRLKKFIKIFKSDLITIEIEKKEVGSYYLCTMYFVYQDYKIHAEFESTGVKKLVTLFGAFEKIEEGGIVFIDELDANLHDVYLCKLLEYFKEYAKGQLCFTTHNLGPMDVLKSAKHAIDFLSNDAKIVSWKNSGNYSVRNMYKEGMIENSPFNVQASDFVGIFSKEGDAT